MTANFTNMLTEDIETPRLRLACLREDHVTEKYRAWMVDPEVNQYLETRFAKPSVESLREYVAGLRASSHSYFFGIFSKGAGSHLGNIKLGPVSYVHNSATIGLVLGDRSAWGQGIASEAIAAVSEWGFADLGLDKITAGSYHSNAGSVRAFQKCGFAIEGVQRSQVRLDNGGRDDVILLGRIRASVLVERQ